MISRDELAIRIRLLQGELRARGVTHMALFGSQARGDAREDSDVDLMVDVGRTDFSLLDLIGIEHRLTDELGIPVQISMRRSISERLRQRTTDDLIELF